MTTPETYLGSARALNFANGRIAPGAHGFGALPASLDTDQFAYGGRWRIGREAATAGAGARLAAEFNADKVFLVMGSPGGARRLRVLLDGRPIPDRLAGEDVRDGAASISAQRLYRLVNLERPGRHRLKLRFQPGIAGYAFTFG